MFAGPTDATNLPLSKETTKPGRPKVDNEEENKEDGILTGSTLSKIVQELESYARSSDFESDHDETKSNASYSIASHFSDGTNVSYPYSESSSPLLIKGKISELINPPSNVPPTNTVAVKLEPINTSKNDDVVVTENETPKTFESVAARLFRARQTFVANSDPHPNRKEEMTLLMKEYKRLSMNLKALVASVREYQVSNHWLQQARYVFFSDCANMCNDNFRIHGFCPDTKNMDPTVLARISVSESLQNMREGQRLMADGQANFQRRSLLDYVSEWEEIVSKDIAKQVKILTKLGNEEIKYSKRTRVLQQKKSKTGIWRFLPSTSSASARVADKLNRTLSQLNNTKLAYNEKESEVIFLLQVVIKQGWKDLYPLLQSTMEAEISRVLEEDATFGNVFPDVDQRIDQVFDLMSKERDIKKQSTCKASPRSLYGDSTVVMDSLDDSSRPYLFIDDASPFAARAWIALLEKTNCPSLSSGFHVKYVCSALGLEDPGFALMKKMNLVETPVLVHEGNVLSGSRALVTYIDQAFPSEECLTPNHAIESFNMYTFMNNHSKIEGLLFNYLESDETTQEACLKKINDFLQVLDDDLKRFSGPFLCGNQFTLADICVFPFIEHIRILLGTTSVESDLPGLDALRSWYDAVSSRPSVQTVIADRTQESMKLLYFKKHQRKEYLSEYHQCFSKGEFLHHA